MVVVGVELDRPECEELLDGVVAELESDKI